MAGNDWDDDDNGLDGLVYDAPETDDHASGLDALPEYTAHDVDVHDGDHDGFETFAEDDAAEEDDPDIPVVQAVNPPGTVTVTAYLDGSIARVDLAPTVTGLSETQLADEIRVVAGVASMRATAVVHVGVVKMLVEQGLDVREAQDYVERNLPFCTPEEAGKAELALIARHADHHEPA